MAAQRISAMFQFFRFRGDHIRANIHRILFCMLLARFSIYENSWLIEKREKAGPLQGIDSKEIGESSKGSLD